ncbi:MAG: right-handed parallel beta-helix repeat-containing protein [Planctomycetota bacterium]
MRSRGRLALLCLLAVASSATYGCNRFDPRRGIGTAPAGPPGDGGEGIGVSSQIAVEYPLFGGLQDAVAGDGTIYLAWQDADDNNDAPDSIRYRVYLASGPGDQQFTLPALSTQPGALSASLAGLVNGVTYFVVVRAVDTEGFEDENRVEWAATPNSVRYIDATASAIGADGLTPTTAFPTTGAAVGAAIGLGGVNFYVRGGSYTQNVVLFAGMCLYGGFDSSFTPELRDPLAHASVISSSFAGDVVTMLSGSELTVIDGCVLDGNHTASNGVRADDAFVRISRCEIRDNLLHGVELRSDHLSGSAIEGSVRNCAIVGSGGEGLLIAALTDLVIDNNSIRDNANEGIESQWVFAATGYDTRIEVTRNVVLRNGNEGIDLDFAEVSELDPTLSAGARLRVVVRNNLVRDNREGGINIDLDFENSDRIDFRARVEDNQVNANGVAGILVDGDAMGALRFARNAITANRGPGLVISGTPMGPWVRILNSRISGNAGAGIVVNDHLGLELRYSLLSWNGGGALTARLAFVDASGCIFASNDGSVVAPSRLRYSIVYEDAVPAGIGPDIVTAEPRLQHQPVFVARVVGQVAGAGVIPLASSAGFLVGDLVEVRDDGVARIVTAVGANSVTVSPAPDDAMATGDAIYNHRGFDDVQEREGLLTTSPAINAGDPLERDRDGSVPDLGTIGGDTPGNVGVETGLALEESALELTAARPSAGMLSTELESSFWFNQEPSIAVAQSVRMFVDGAIVPRVVKLVAGDQRIDIKPVAPIAAGQQISIEFLLRALNPANEQFPTDPRTHFFFDFRAAAALGDGEGIGPELDGTTATATQLAPVPVIASGSTGFAGDRDWYRMELAAGRVIFAELVAGRAESPLVARLTLLAADGVTVLATAAAAPPTSLDPILAPYTAGADTSVYVVVESVDAEGSLDRRYALHLDIR